MDNLATVALPRKRKGVIIMMTDDIDVRDMERSRHRERRNRKASICYKCRGKLHRMRGSTFFRCRCREYEIDNGRTVIITTR